jgi:CheY-like chemotaxis protein
LQQIALTFEKGRIPPISADPGQLGQVLHNLVSNAIDAVLGSSQRKITIRTRIENDMAVLTISDTGPGIPEEDLPRLFTPFFSTKGEHARKGSYLAKAKGAGLGLSISDTIIKSHGGEILGYNNPDMGATFEIRLPVVRTRPAGETSKTIRTGKVGCRVLVVDDEELVLSFMGFVLKAAGFEVFTADSTEKALEESGKRRFDVAVVDLNLRGEDAVALVRSIKNAGTRQPKYIVVSGELKGDKLLELEKLGVDVFLGKPFGRAELLGAVQKALE